MSVRILIALECLSEVYPHTTLQTSYYFTNPKLSKRGVSTYECTYSHSTLVSERGVSSCHCTNQRTYSHSVGILIAL